MDRRGINAAPVPAGDGTYVTQQQITPMAGGRYCARRGYGWYCFYADSDQRGWSIGKTACGTSDLPRWFWDSTSSR